MKKRKHLSVILVAVLVVAALAACLALLPAIAAVTSGGSSVAYYPSCAASNTNFADALDILGIDSSVSNRTVIAAANGIDNYTGTAAQDAMLLALLKAGMLVQSVPDPVETTTRPLAYYNDYETIGKVYDLGSCPSMQGLAVGSQYLYTIKIKTDDSSAFISMMDKDTGKTTNLINAANGGYYFTYLSHANDMDVWGIDGYSNIFVTSTEENSNAIVRFRREGNYLYKAASYSLTYNGEPWCATALAVKGVSNGMITFITKLGMNIYTGSVSTSATSANIELTKVCTINKSSVYINGEHLDLSSYVNQGFGYYDGKLFVPISGDDSNLNQSVILVFDIENTHGGTVYADEKLSFRITSSYYGALFEMESCDICSGDGKLYFNTNSRITDSNTNHDGVHVILDYVYEDF